MVSFRTLVKTFSCFFASAALIASLSPTAAPAADNVWDFVEATNQARLENGLAPLFVNDALMNSSGAHARDMATRNYFSHWTLEGWDAALRIYGWGYSRSAGIGENIAAGELSPWEVVRDWLASPGHRANLLNPAFRSLGVGHFYQPGSSYTNYWVGHYGTE